MAARRIESEVRTEKIRCRVTPSTRYALDAIEAETGINPAALLAAIGLLRERRDAAAVYTLKTVFNAAPKVRRRSAA